MLLLKDLTQTHGTECTYWTSVYSMQCYYDLTMTAQWVIHVPSMEEEGSIH